MLLSVYPSVRVCFSLCTSLHPSVSSSICSSICLSVLPSVSLSIHLYLLFIHLPAFPSICLSLHPSVHCPLISPSICPSVHIPDCPCPCTPLSVHLSVRGPEKLNVSHFSFDGSPLIKWSAHLYQKVSLKNDSYFTSYTWHQKKGWNEKVQPYAQRILKEEVSLYHWPPVWPVWISLFCK